MPLFPTQGGQTSPFSSDTLLQLGVGLLSGKNAQEQVAGAAQGFMSARKQNQTLEFLRQKNPELAAAVESGALPAGDAFKLHFQNELEAKKPRNNYIPVGKQLFDTATQQWITPPAGSTADAAEYGLNPIYGTDANGNTVIGQVGKDGSFHQVDTSGFKPVGSTTNQNLGTSIVTRDRAGNLITSAPIDNEGKQLDENTGKNLAANRQALPQVEASANQLLSSIDSLAQDPYLPNMVGPVAGRWSPNLTGDSQRVQSKMDQIGGQSFLQAFNMLRGAGQITEIEGDKATKAMARLNTAQSETDYRQALTELREIVSTAVTRAKIQAGVGGGGAGAGGGSNPGGQASGLNWRVK